MRDEVATVVTDGIEDTRIGRRSSWEPSDPRRLTEGSIGRLGPSMNCDDSFANKVIGPALLITGDRCGIVEDVIEAIQGDLADAWGVGHTSRVRSMPRGGKGFRQSIIGGQLRSHHVQDLAVVDDPRLDVHGIYSSCDAAEAREAILIDDQPEVTGQSAIRSSRERQEPIRLSSARA